jgi:hypothetical protein
MDEYLRRARAVLAKFQAAVDAFDSARRGIAPGAGLNQKQLKSLEEIVERVRAAVKRLEHSLTQISGETALDVVDLQVRLEGETTAVASALKALGELVIKAPDIIETTGGTLYALEENAERVAAAIFPNAIEGLREINRTLWDFRPIWNEYSRTLAKEVAKPAGNGLTTDQIARVEQTANQVRARFDDVNELLNQLVVAGAASGPGVQSFIRQARQTLSAAVREAKSKAADAYKPFHGVLKRAEGVARKIDGQFADLRVPVFPEATSLDELVGLIDPTRYAELAGVERFALLNISARLRSIPLAVDGSGHLLSPQFAIRVFDVFPDRVYFTADASFITAVQALKEAQVFEEAPASLHRFKDGSFKQRAFRKGNLQLSYAFGSPGQSSDRTKVCVDADIDLYRSSIRHLFGEVLVNHLTGSKTDQFKVWDILTSSRVVPIGSFDVVTV